MGEKGTNFKYIFFNWQQISFVSESYFGQFGKNGTEKYYRLTVIVKGRLLFCVKIVAFNRSRFPYRIR